MLQRVVIDNLSLIELAAHLCGVDAWAEDFDEDDLYERFYNKFNMCMYDFCKAAEYLVPLIDVGTGISGTTYKGFAADGAFLVKTEA